MTDGVVAVCPLIHPWFHVQLTVNPLSLMSCSQNTRGSGGCVQSAKSGGWAAEERLDWRGSQSCSWKQPAPGHERGWEGEDSKHKQPRALWKSQALREGRLRSHGMRMFMTSKLFSAHLKEIVEYIVFIGVSWSQVGAFKITQTATKMHESMV